MLWCLGKGIGDDGAKGVAKLLSALTFFTEVNLSGLFYSTDCLFFIRLFLDNKIGNSGFKSLAEMIRVNSSLTSIDLSCLFFFFPCFFLHLSL